jgi:hypothetical protein
MGESVNAYLNFALTPKGIERHGFLRKLFALSRKLTGARFIASIERAHKYRITDMAIIERIAALSITQGIGALPFMEIDEAFRQRDSYLEGRLTDAPDLSIYENITEDDHE